jgi:polyribonucleotide nucleotidyltransferase
MIHTHTFEIGGKTLSLETGRVAKQAGGAVLLGMGETVILGVATMSENAREGIDFLPLVCDYEERKYAVGKIPGGFMKRGGRPSEKAVLTSRLIDRPLRPLFPKGLRHDVQVIAMPFAVDRENPADALAICAAGAALTVSDVPFKGPVAGVRVGLIGDDFVLFPNLDEIKESVLDLVVAGHKGAISMVEAGALEVSEETMVEALAFAHEAIREICAEFEKFGKMAGKPKREPKLYLVDEKLIEEIKKGSGKQIEASITDPDKVAREQALGETAKELIAEYAAKYADDPEKVKQLPEAVDKAIKDSVRQMILKKDKRPDGRGLRDIRNLEAVAGLLPRVHGSGLFTRGQTQVMTVCTLGMPSDAQIVDGLEDDEDKRYMHFYNFPPYSVGEVRPMRAAGRREIGHGALAERALRPVVPIDDPEFPYTLLLISEVLESNGSTSMASVCGSTLALMDAGVPIKAPVAGIAMGLMSDGKVFKVLTDIQGMEDFCGDMDFKVAGTREGITALQLDTKLDGIPEKVLADALAQAKEARMAILDVIEEEIPAPRSDYAMTAPRVTTIMINPEKIGALIGPGGSTIRKITTESGAQIDVQQDGRVLVAANDGESAQIAIDAIRALTATAEIGAEFTGKVTRLMGRGAMVEYLPGREGLVPTDQLSPNQLRRPDDVVSVGDTLNVRVHEIDGMGRVNLTAIGIKQELASLAGNENATPPPPGQGGGDRGGRDRGGRDRDRGGRDRDRGGRDRGPRDGERGSRDDRSPRDEDRGNRAIVEERAPEVPDEYPKKARADEDVNARFRPRR